MYLNTRDTRTRSKTGQFRHQKSSQIGTMVRNTYQRNMPCRRYPWRHGPVANRKMHLTSSRQTHAPTHHATDHTHRCTIATGVRARLWSLAGRAGRHNYFGIHGRKIWSTRKGKRSEQLTRRQTSFSHHHAWPCAPAREQRAGVLHPAVNSIGVVG